MHFHCTTTQFLSRFLKFYVETVEFDVHTRTSCWLCRLAGSSLRIRRSVHLPPQAERSSISRIRSARQRPACRHTAPAPALQGSDGQALQQVAHHGQEATVRVQPAQRPSRSTRPRVLPEQCTERVRNPRSDIVRLRRPPVSGTRVRAYWTAWRSTQRHRIRYIALQTRDGA